VSEKNNNIYGSNGNSNNNTQKTPLLHHSYSPSFNMDPHQNLIAFPGSPEDTK